MLNSRLIRPPSVYALLAAFLLLIAGAGCRGTEKQPAPKTAAEPGRAKPLIIGLIPEQSLFKQMDRYEPLARYLARRTGIEIQLVILSRYGHIISNFQSAKMDGAFFGSFTYALAHVKLGVDVLARPEGLDGASTYHGLIFVRKDSGIRNARDMKGKRFAFVDKATTAGFLLPLAYFHDNGIPDHKKYLKETYFAGTHEDVVYDVLNKKADVGAAKNTVYNRIARENPKITAELVVLTRSPEVPENGLALRKDIDPALRGSVKDALLAMDRDPDGKKALEQFGAKRFIETTNADYAVVQKYVEDIHLNLATYDYMND